MSTKAIIKANGFIVHSGYDGMLLGIGKYIAKALSSGNTNGLDLINLLLKDIEYTRLIVKPEIWEWQYTYNITYVLRDKPEDDIEVWTYYIEVNSRYDGSVFEGWLIDFINRINREVEFQNNLIRSKKANEEFCPYDEQSLVEPIKTEYYKFVGGSKSKALPGCENV